MEIMWYASFELQSLRDPDCSLTCHFSLNYKDGSYSLNLAFVLLSGLHTINIMIKTCLIDLNIIASFTKQSYLFILFAGTNPVQV